MKGDNALILLIVLVAGLTGVCKFAAIREMVKDTQTTPSIIERDFARGTTRPVAPSTRPALSDELKRLEFGMRDVLDRLDGVSNIEMTALQSIPVSPTSRSSLPDRLPDPGK